MKRTRRQLLSITACALLFAKVPGLAQTIMPSGGRNGPNGFLGDPNARFDSIDTSGGIVFPTLSFSYDVHDNDSKPRTSSQIPAFIQVSASEINATGKVVSPSGSVVTGAALRPYERLEYQWDFGDPAGNEIFNNYSIYPFTGVPVNANNQQWGPEACYVYRKPGTYTIKLDIRGRNSDGTGYITKTVTRQFTALVNSRTHAFDTNSPPFTGELTSGTQTIDNPSSTANLALGTTLTLVNIVSDREVAGYLAPGTFIGQKAPALHLLTQAPGFENGAILQNLTSSQMKSNNWAIVPSNDFYFDSVNGNDANGGNTPSTPRRGYDNCNNATLPSQIAEVFSNVTSKVAFHFAYGSSWSSPASVISNGNAAVSGIRFAAYENQQAQTADNNPSFTILVSDPSDEVSMELTQPDSSLLIRVNALNVARNNQNGIPAKPSRKQPIGNNNPSLTILPAAPVSLRGSRSGPVGDIVFSNMDFIVDAAQTAASGVACFLLLRGQTKVISDLYLDHCNYYNKGQGETGAIALYVNNPGSYDSRSMGQNFAVWGGRVTCKVFATSTDFMAYGSGTTLAVTHINGYRGDPNNGNKPFNIARFVRDGGQLIQDHGPLPNGAKFVSGTNIVNPITDHGDGTWTITLSRPMMGSIPSDTPVNIWSTYGGSAVIAFGAMQWHTIMGIQESDNGGQGVEYCHTINLETQGKHLLVRWIQTRSSPGWNNTIRNSTGAYNIGGISKAFPQPDLTGGYNLIADCDIQSTPYRWTALGGKGHQLIGNGLGGFGNEMASDPLPFRIDASEKFFSGGGNCLAQLTSACEIALNAQTAPGHRCQQPPPGTGQVQTQMSVYDVSRRAEVGVTRNGGACLIKNDVALVQLGSAQNAAALGPPLISSSGVADTLEFTNGGMANCVFERNNVANIKAFAIGIAANGMTVRDCNVWNFGKYGLYFQFQDYQATCAYRNNFYRPLLPENFGNILYDNAWPVIWFYFGKPVTNTLSQEFTYNTIWDDRGASGSSNGPHLMRLDWASASAITGSGGVFDMNRWYFPNPTKNGNVMQSNADGTMHPFADYQTYGGSPAGSTPYFGPHDTILEAPPWSDPGNGNFGPP